MVISHCSAGSNKDGDTFLELDKPCTCTLGFFCCSRPIIHVHNVEKGGREIVGSIKMPC